MELGYIDAYKKGIGSFPSDDIPFKSKGEKWHLQYAKAIMTEYANNRCGVAYSSRDTILNNRRFAQGTNDETLFQDILLEFDPKIPLHERKAFSNLDYTIIPIIAKFRSDFIGILNATDYRVSANSIDALSVRKKDVKKFTAWIMSFYKDQWAEIDATLQIPQNKSEFIPQTKSELNMYDQLGGFKLGLEEAIEAGMNYCYHVSRWNEEIRPQLTGDIFDNGKCFCRDYLDLKTYTIKQRYVDLPNAIVLGGTGMMYEGAKAFGEWRFISAADLRALTGWDEQKIIKISQSFSGKYGNNYINNWGPVKLGNAFGPYETQPTGYEYDSLLIPVADLEFASNMYEYDVERIDEYGNKSYYKTDRDRKYNRPDRKSSTTVVKVWHKVSYILGSDEVFDWGLQHDIPRPTYEDARSSYHGIRIDGKSLCERAIPFAKQAQLAALQIQNLLAKASPPGISAEWDALQGISLNKNSKGENVIARPMDLLRLRHQTGDIIYRTTTQRGHMQGHGGVPPIRETKGSYDLKEYVELFEYNIRKIGDITGMNDQTVQEADTATAANLSVRATNISLKAFHNAYLAIYKETAINASARLRDLLAYSLEAREIYAPIIGLSKIEMLNIVNDLPTSHLSIKIEINPTDEDKKAIHEAAIAAMKPGKNGTIIMSWGAYLLTKRMIDSGNIKQAQAYIAYVEAEDERKALEREKINQEMNGKNAADQENLKSQNELAKTKNETDEKIRFEVERDRLEKERIQQEHDNTMDELRLQLEIKASQKEMQPA